MVEIRVWALAVCAAFSAHAEITPVDAVWTNMTSAAPAWTTLGNWTDAAGGSIARPPTNVADRAAFAIGPVDNGCLQRISFAVGGTSSVRREFGLAGLVDANVVNPRAISLATSYYASCWEVGAWLTLLDPNGFGGFFTADNGGYGLRLPATEEKPLRLAGVSVAQHVDVEVPAAGTKATIGAVYESGVLRKLGAGDLVVEDAGGAGTTIHVTEGTLTLAGRPAAAVFDAGDDVPVPGAWLHLDANRADTFKTYVDPADGRTCVTNWCDVRGNGAFAYYDEGYRPSAAHYVAATHAPFLNDAAVAGKRVVDFGRNRAAQDASWGPTNCTLVLSERRSDVREVFCVACVKGLGENAVVFGNNVDGSGNYPFHGGGGGYLVSTTYGNKGAVFGDVLKNGLPVGNKANWPKFGEMGVVSIGLTNAVAVGALGSDRNYGDGRVGGILLAEAILFTNALTHAERLRVHRYLQRKWTPELRADAPCEVGAVTLAEKDNAIGVPEGRTAFVQEVNAAGGTLVKTGGGTLVVGALASSVSARPVKIDVRGGEVKFGGLAAVDDTAPAAEPCLWLKAERASLVLENDGLAERVVRWNDCRAGQTARYAQTPEGEIRPTLAAGVVGELDAVDFGRHNEAKSKSYLKIVGVGRTVYDAFVVHCDLSSSGLPVFGNVNCDFYPGGTTRFVKDALDRELGYSTQTAYGGPVGRNARWTFNGAVVDPGRPGQAVRVNGEWNVMGVSVRSPACMDTLGDMDREKQYGYGGCRLGEVVYYDRRLTPDERRQTIAYLMKKWRAAVPYAAAGARISEVVLPAGTTAAFETDVSMAAGTIEKPYGAVFEKRGVGTLAVDSSLAACGMRSIAVEAGTLTFGPQRALDVCARSILHFDATDLPRMAYFVTEDPDGAPRTNLVSVAGPRATAGLKAYFSAEAPAPSFAHPTLKTVEVAAGRTMPVFDFGRLNMQQSVATASRDAGSFDVSPVCKTVREAHVVYADTLTAAGTAAKGMDVFADRGYSLDYFRGQAGRLLTSIPAYSNYVATARAGEMAVDGVRFSGEEALDYVLAPGFHLVSAFPAPSAKSATGSVTIGALGNTHNCAVGGCQVGELVAFEQPLSAEESAALQEGLAAKWFGGAVASRAWTQRLDALDVAAGATLALGEDALAVARLAGAGTVAARRVTAGESLALAAGRPLAVLGAFAQTGPLAVSVDSAQPLGAGEYEILRAGSFEGLDLARWKISAELAPGFTARAVRKGNAVFLKVWMPRGFVLLLTSRPSVEIGPAGDVPTLAAALERVRELRRSGAVAPETPVRVQIPAGVHALDGPLEVSGDVAPVEFVGAGRDETVLSGGRELGPFAAGSDGVWTCDAPDGLAFEQLWVNGKRATRAKSPNKFYHYVLGVAGEEVNPLTGQLENLERQKFTVAPEVAALLAATPEDELADVVLHVWWSWDTEFRRIARVDQEKSTVLLTQKAARDFFMWPTYCPRITVENCRAALDAPGEWFHDRKAGKILYVPRAGEHVETATAVVPVTDRLVRVRDADGVSFCNLTFAYNGSALPANGLYENQSAYSAEAALDVRNAARVRIVNCRVAHTANYGVWFDEGTADSEIRHTLLEDLGAGGVRLGARSWTTNTPPEKLVRRVRVDDNVVTDGGHVFPAGTGVFCSFVRDCTITHNEICDFFYSGITCGWTWGYGPTPNRDNEISWNHVHHLGKGVLSDMGVIYTLGDNAGTVVCGNHGHDVFSYGYTGSGGTGLYPDEGSTGILWTSNLIHHTKTSALSQHYGKENRFVNNVFAFNVKPETSVAGRWRVEPHVSLVASNNVFVWSGACKAWKGPGSGPSAVSDLVFGSNLWWSPDPIADDAFNFGSFAAWRASGMDAGSVVADPLFRDWENGDWRLRPESPAFGIGFKEWDYGFAGVRKTDAAWRARAEALVPTPYEVPPEPPLNPGKSSFSTGFELVAPGAFPADVFVGSSSPEKGYVRATREVSRTGAQAIEFVDFQGLSPKYMPYVYQEFAIASDVFRLGFSIKCDARADFICEWRDYNSVSGAGQYADGPYLLVQNGEMALSARRRNDVGETVSCRVAIDGYRPGLWCDVVFTVRYDQNGSPSWDCSVVSEDGTVSQTVTGLLFKDARCVRPGWLGFISNADCETVVHVDDYFYENE